MKRSIILTLASVIVAGTAAFALPVTPLYTSFGSLPAATFNPAGPSGNPNNAVAITTIVDGANTITLGLAAQQRYLNPPLANNGAGIFYATPGANLQGPGPTLGSKWNFDFYANISGPGSVANYTFELIYGFIPNVAPTGVYNLNNASLAVGGSPTAKTLQDSENLMFSFLSATIPGIISPPPGVYNPNANGVYGFELLAIKGSTTIGTSAIDVSVGSVPETSSTVLLFGLGLASLLAFGHKQNARRVAS